MIENVARLAEIRARAEAATEGPWLRYGDPSYEVYADPDAYEDGDSPYITHGSPREADAAFIKHARTDMPDLLAAVDRLREREAKIRELHSPFKIYDECAHLHHTPAEVEIGNAIEVEEIGLTCDDGLQYRVCGHCCMDADGYHTEGCIDGHKHGKDVPICPTTAILDGTAADGQTYHWGPDPAFGNLCKHVGPRIECSGPDCEDDDELPGMWESADFTGGLDYHRPAGPTTPGENP